MPYDILYETVHFAWNDVSWVDSRSFWGAEIAQQPPTISYDEIMGTEDGVKKWTSLLVR